MKFKEIHDSILILLQLCRISEKETKSILASTFLSILSGQS